MSVHRYPPQSLIGDYSRAGLGLILTVTPLLFIELGTAIAIMLVLVAAVCLFFLVRTIERNRTIISLDDEAISASGFRRATVRWADLARLTLAYYSVKRDKSDGWMQLTLKDAAGTVVIDSRLDGFYAIVVKAARVAREKQLPLNHITLTNLQALKITGE